MPATLEKTIENGIRRELDKIPRSWHCKNYGSDASVNGMPDLTFIHDGRAFFFEVKQPGKAAEPVQGWRIRQLIHAGAVACAVTSWSDVREVLSKHGVL